MDDLINRQTAIAEAEKIADGNASIKAWAIIGMIRSLPPAEPERKRGKWIDHSDDGYVECPFCRSATNCDDNINELNYCFSCGAKMEE